MKQREGRHDGSRNPNYQHSSEASAKGFGRVVWNKCNAKGCGYTFKTRPDGKMNMDDFRSHKATHELVAQTKYTHGA